jgi:competence protein ComEC
VRVYRTDLQGTITAASDGKVVSITTEKNADIQTNPTATVTNEAYYIGNARSQKFHRPDCSVLPDEKNRIIFDTRAAAVEAEYDPCEKCKP